MLQLIPVLVILSLLVLILLLEENSMKKFNNNQYIRPDPSIKEQKNISKEELESFNSSYFFKSTRLENAIRRQDKVTSEFKLSYESPINILICSGSKLNLIDIDYCNDYNIPYSHDEDLLQITDDDGQQTLFGITPPLTLRYKDHLCKTKFFVTDLPTNSCILGLDWLQEHNPDINFRNNELIFRSNYCTQYCFSLSNNDPEFSSAFDLNHSHY